MTELRDLDLGGAPYGYTPFCDSRTEMDGFRFWKQGYWRNHLQGRRYHISALYVVDLRRFRRIAAGDRLRGQYQALSQDPNSLSNLDQVFLLSIIAVSMFLLTEEGKDRGKYLVLILTEKLYDFLLFRRMWG
jgi:hypothetical protein